jgi:hypothetical protein
MMMGGMFFMMVWMVLGGLLFVALLAVLIWFLVRWLNTQRTPVGPQPWQQDFSRGQQQGYQSSPYPPSGTPPQEGERVYRGSSPSYEQPQVEYPQEQHPPHQ